MKFIAKVYQPMYDHNDKKYIRVVIPENCCEIIKRMQANKAHLIKNNHIDNPLDGRILTIKVPFRYRRVMCKVEGKPVQSLIKDDEIEIDINFMGVWNVGEYSGYSWKLNYITLNCV
jgi:hypothetical protein